MIVVDASALVALVAGRYNDVDRAADLLDVDAHWVVPEHTVIEAVSAMRNLTLRGSMTLGTLVDGVQKLVDFQLDVWPTAPLLGRVIELMHNVTAYDAAYLALAEELETSLVTLDRRLMTVPGIRCEVRAPRPDS